MAKIPEDITELIGSTPLVRLKKYENDHNVKAHLFAKLESFNPAGSIKDRTAYYMIKDAEESGKLKPGATIIEPTSGNTGIGLACVACRRGYKVILTMPDTMSVERISLLKAYNAEVVLTDGVLGMNGAIERAEELHSEIQGSIIAGQFVNPANVRAHYETTAPEVWEQTEGKIDVFVCGIGTGGTLTGCAKFFKEKNPGIKIIAVEPYDSPLLTKGVSGSHALMGIGANFIPEILDTALIDEVIDVTTDEAYSALKALAASEGYFIGISSAAALHAAQLAAEKYIGKNIAVIFPDGGDRYLSVGIF